MLTKTFMRRVRRVPAWAPTWVGILMLFINPCGYGQSAINPMPRRLGPGDRVPVRMLFRDARTSKPLAGVSLRIIQEPFMLDPRNEPVSGPDGMMIANIMVRQNLIFLGSSHFPVSMAPGTIISDGSRNGLWLPDRLEEKPLDDRPLFEVAVVPILDNKKTVFSMVDGMGHPIRDGVVAVDGGVRWPMTDQNAMQRPKPAATNESWHDHLFRQAVGRITVAKSHSGKARLYFQRRDGRNQALRIGEDDFSSSQAGKGCQAAFDEKGEPCLEVDFDAVNPVYGLTVIQLIDCLELPDEEVSPNETR